ncbi:hypothetical protein [Haloferula sp. BvORR071]|uniref:hypothetical protein n=1 Tax=Haloferula sp. BvORR071 TaxID=1396141 RepID=UPI0005514667|nr:hypothetical protein [Haloferula sp. BvORR071]
MDTLKLLFCMAFAGLVAVLGVSWKDFKKARAGEDPKKVYEVNRQIAEIRKDKERMQADRDRILGREVPKTPVVPEATPEESSAVPSEADLAAIDAASSLSNPDAALPSEGLVPAPPPQGEGEATPPQAVVPAVPAPPPAPAPALQDRAAMILAAPAVAKIKTWEESPELGSFCTLEVKDAAVVKTGAVLVIRRNSGIIGRVTVGEVTPEAAGGNPSGILDELKPQVGDELIVDPAGR